MKYPEALEAYNALEFDGRKDFYGWHRFLMGLLPKKKETGDNPGVRFNLTSEEIIPILGKYYVKRDLGTEYGILPPGRKEMRRREFCYRHRLLSEGDTVPETPEELQELYVSVHKGRWSKNGRINKEQVHTIYNEVRGNQMGRLDPSWIDDNWEAGTGEINKRMYDDIIMPLIPTEQLGLFD